MKFRDKIAVAIVRKINMNPEKKDSVIKKLKLYTKLGKLVPHRLKRGYERLNYHADGMPLEVFKRKGSESKKIIYIVHGGAFIMGLINTYRNLYSVIGKAANDAAVAIIDYRVAPDNKYPAAHDDITAGWEFLQNNLGYKACDIILMGDSSGGNLILSLLLKLRDERKPMPAAAVAMSPWINFLATGESYKSNYNRDIIFGHRKSVPNETNLQKILESDLFSYAGNADRNDPYVAPVLGEYHGMPPILLTAGSHEMLLDDILTVSEKINAAGGRAKLIIGIGMFHAYPLFYKISPTAKEAFKEILSFLKEHTI